MRASVFSIVVVISAMMPLGSCEVASSRSSLEGPSLFALHKHPASPSTRSMFGIPRGGASTTLTKRANLASVKSKVESSGAFSSTMKSIISEDKIGWAVSFAISLVYLFLFMTLPGNTCDVNSGGFCVANFDGTKCPDRYSNSHTWAFVVDVIFTALAFIVPTDQSNLVRWGIAAVILSHGILHGVLGILVECSPIAFPGAEKIFGVFSAFVSIMVLQLGGTLSIPLNVLIGGAAGLLTVKLSEGDRGVASIFLITQLLASGCATFFAKDGFVTPLMGKTFVLPCIISIIELVFCCDGEGPSWFNQLGGHVWYDVFLHISVLAALKPAAEKE